MKPNTKNGLILILGIVVLILGIGGWAVDNPDNATIIDGSDSSNLVYIVLGIVLIIGGIVGLYRNQPRIYK